MIQLDENERKIVNAVRDYANSRNPPTVARFAGGWVRDKIMGLSSHDIDVALDNTSGYVFATGLSERLLLEEYSEKTLENTEELLQGPSVHKIQANPDKSKHLETAVVCICGISIDFANLRSEKYAEGRIPTIQPGTPLEDALRRDLTINSLFYNLNTEEIEDYTGKGLGDIEKRVIRTPLDPKVTLLEDPLRILRIFRFKAKMGFTIDPSIYEALELPNIRSALRNKVSIERINVELFKMLDYESGWVGMIEIIRTGYGPIIFAPGCDKEVNEFLSLSFFERCKEFVSKLQSYYDSNRLDFKSLDCNPLNIEEIVWENIEKKIIWLYMVLHNYIGIKTDNMDYVNVKVVQNSLKGDKGWIKRIRAIEEGIEYMCSEGDDSTVKKVLKCKNHLFEILMISKVTGRLKDADVITLEILRRRIYNSYKVFPIVNGHDLKDFKIPSRNYRELLFNCFVYQIENPKATKGEILKHFAKKLNM